MKEVNLEKYKKIESLFSQQINSIVKARIYGNKEDWTISKIQFRFFWRVLKEFGLLLFLGEMIKHQSFYKTTAWSVAEKVVNDNYYKISNIEDEWDDEDKEMQ